MLYMPQLQSIHPGSHNASQLEASSVEEGGLLEGKTGQVCTGWLCADVHVSLYYCTVNSSQDFV